jgi:hypothetical protein
MIERHAPHRAGSARAGSVQALARAIAYHRGQPEFWRDWHSRLISTDGATALSNLVGDIRSGEGRAATVLLSLDQFEELFIIAEETERESFLPLDGATAPAVARMQRYPGWFMFAG